MSTNVKTVLLVVVMACIGCGSQETLKLLMGPYLGQSLPGSHPVLFAPDVVSRSFDERMAFFSPDGRELLYQLRGAPFSVIILMRDEGKGWSKPVIAPFSGRYFAEFGLSPDGNTVILTTNQPLEGKGDPSDRFHTFFIHRTDGCWGKPYYAGENLDDIGYPTMTNAKHLYFFCYHREGGHGLGDIWMSHYLGDGYGEPVNLGTLVNSDGHDVDPFIAPDESYIIFTSEREGQFGNGDLYISFRDQSGTWTSPVNMGSTINTGATEFCATVTFDGKYLFFASDRNDHRPYADIPITFEEKMRILQSPGNGSNDIYWVEAGIIEELRPSPLSLHE